MDSWDVDSSYPNGHFVRTLGRIGDLEAEVAAILVENDLRVPPFSEAQVGTGGRMCCFQGSGGICSIAVKRILYFSLLWT